MRQLEIVEIFYSFQGEGLLIGYPQIFVRLAGCNLACAYCDEVYTHKKTYTIAQALTAISSFYPKQPYSIAITGGEPLLQIEALQELGPQILFPLYLETNGTLPQHLQKGLELFTWFSVDYKPGYLQEFLAFMGQLKNKPNVFVKYVVAPDFAATDLENMAQKLAQINRQFPLILQPVTPYAGFKAQATPADLARAFEIAAPHLATVRIIPQTHKLMGFK